MPAASEADGTEAWLLAASPGAALVWPFQLAAKLQYHSDQISAQKLQEAVQLFPG